MNIEILSQQIKDLEEALLHTDHKNNPDILEQYLAQDFEEIGSNGEIHGRDLVVQWLLKKETNARWLLQNFSLRALSENLLLVKYQAKQIAPISSSSLGSMRSSVWKRADSERVWQMVFHQATKILYR